MAKLISNVYQSFMMICMVYLIINDYNTVDARVNLIRSIFRAVKNIDKFHQQSEKLVVRNMKGLL